MPFLGKALYNLFFLQGQREYAELATLPVEELFARLKQLGFSFDQESFGYLAADAESPEELFEMLGGPAEQVYLLLFELWKRLIPDKKSISLFCDELDHLIHEHDLAPQGPDEKLQEKIFLLQDILDGGVDQGENPQEIFALVSDYMAHDLESFLYDYIYEQIELGKETLASELLDGFYPYIQELLWFDYLRLKLFLAAPGEELATFFAHFMEALMAKPDSELLIEVLDLLLEKDCQQLFLTLFRFTVNKITTKEQLSTMLQLASRYSFLVGNKEKGRLFEEGASAPRLDFHTDPFYSHLTQI
jgi:hypothetical protein